MRGSEFVDRVKRIAARGGVTFQFSATRGKGSHGTVWLGARFTVVPSLRHELKKGTLAGMCRALGIRPQDLHDV